MRIPVAEETAVINVQGDQPFIDPAVIDAMAEEFQASGSCASCGHPRLRAEA